MKRWINNKILGKQKTNMSLHDEEHVSDEVMYQQHTAVNQVNMGFSNERNQEPLAAVDQTDARSVQPDNDVESINSYDGIQKTKTKSIDTNSKLNTRGMAAMDDDEPRPPIMPAPSTEEVLSAFHGFLFPQIAPIRISTFIILTALTAIP